MVGDPDGCRRYHAQWAYTVGVDISGGFVWAVSPSMAAWIHAMYASSSLIEYCSTLSWMPVLGPPHICGRVSRGSPFQEVEEAIDDHIREIAET